jgi:peptidoglycan/LPS O-acetylase OafA/YrhL
LCYIVLAVFSVLGLLSRRSLFLASWCGCYAFYIAININPTIEVGLSERVVTFVSLFVYFGCGVLLYLFRERIPFSPVLTCGAFALVLAVLPLGAGPFVMPICLPYIVMFCGLSSVPGKALLRHDLSYGVYLIHAPILVAFSLTFPNMHIWWIGAASIFLVTLVLAYVSWIFVEGPAMRRKKAVANWVHRRIESSMLLGASNPIQPPAAERR